MVQLNRCLISIELMYLHIMNVYINNIEQKVQFTINTKPFVTFKMLKLSILIMCIGICNSLTFVTFVHNKWMSVKINPISAVRD